MTKRQKLLKKAQNIRQNNLSPRWGADPVFKRRAITAKNAHHVIRFYNVTRGLV